jgi:transmembrane sensor
VSRTPLARSEEEAAAWFARMRSPEAERHREAFDAWLRDPENAAAYRQAQEDWLLVGGVAPAHLGAHPPRSTPRRTARPQWAIAATLFLAIALGMGWYLQTRPDAPQLTEALSAPDIMRLADGTEVVLGAGATIAVAFDGEARRVTLKGGHARFNVTHDATRPFTVFAGSSATTALGTLFEVDLRAARPRIHLIEGSVEVRSTGAARTVRLAPGEIAEVEGAEIRRLATMPSAGSTTQINAENLPLGVAIERANRANAVPITLADPALATRRLTGRFDLADSAALARKLAAALDLDLVTDDSSIILAEKRKQTGG